MDGSIDMFGRDEEEDEGDQNMKDVQESGS